MPMLLIITLILFLSFFLFMGVLAFIKKSNRKWIYFSLASFCLIGTILVFTINHWNWDEIGKSERAGSENTEGIEKEKIPKKNVEKKPTKQNDSGAENPPQNEPPPPSNPTEEPDPIQPPSQQPLTPTEPTPVQPQIPVKPQEPTPSIPGKIEVPENGVVEYIVMKGDTLWSISQRSAVTVEKIKRWNGITSDLITVGQVLKLYGKNSEPAPANPEPPPTTASSVLISHGNLQKKQITFTFDAGSDIAGITILDVLKKHNVKATFFLTGKWADKFPDYARRIANDGHEIGNHTYSHPDAVNISSATFLQEINKAEQAILLASGKTPRPYLRFPYGSYNASALKTAGTAGYPLSIQWSLDTIDWQQPSVDVIISRIESGASNGDIILMHIGGINTPAAVDKVIPILTAKGYQLVVLSQLLK